MISNPPQPSDGARDGVTDPVYSPRGFAWWPEAVLLMVAAVLLFSRLGVDELCSADEAIHAQVAREAARDGHWLHLTYRGEPYFEKPPLKIWLTALTYLVAGESEFTARLWSALFALGTVWAVADLGARMFNRRAGLAAGLCLATTWNFLFNHCARSGDQDVALLFFMTMTVSACWRFRTTGRGGFLYLAAAMLAMGCLTKGHVALLPLLWLPWVWKSAGVRPGRDDAAGFSPGSRVASPSRSPLTAAPTSEEETGSSSFAQASAVAKAMADESGDKLPPSTAWVRAGLVFLVMAAPWFLLQAVHYGARYSDYMLRHNLVGYTMGRVEDADTAWWYYSEQILWRDYPWPPLVVLGLVMLFRPRVMEGLASWKPARAWLLAWAGVTAAVFLAARTKLPWYYLPAWIPMTLLAGLAVERIWSLGARAWRWLALWLGLHLGLLFCLLGFAAGAWTFLGVWWAGDVLEVRGWHHYFFVDPSQRSVAVAVAALGAAVACGLGFAMTGRFSRNAGSPWTQGWLVALVGVAMVFTWRDVRRPSVGERAREEIAARVAWLENKNRPVRVWVDDPFRESAPHFTISPAYYYYLSGTRGLRIEPTRSLGPPPDFIIRGVPVPPAFRRDWHPPPTWQPAGAGDDLPIR